MSKATKAKKTMQAVWPWEVSDTAKISLPLEPESTTFGEKNLEVDR